MSLWDEVKEDAAKARTPEEAQARGHRWVTSRLARLTPAQRHTIAVALPTLLFALFVALVGTCGAVVSR